MKKIILIPVRLNSKRLPSKALLKLDNLPLIIHTYKRACLSKYADEVYVCTDSERIIKVCINFSVKYIKTKSVHRNGTERIAEAAKKLRLNKKDIIIDVQGDEPLIDPKNIDQTIKFHLKNDYEIVVPHLKINKLTDKNIVKIISVKNNVKWMTRKNIPFFKNFNKVSFKKHLSIITFNFNSIIKFSKIKPSIHEKLESIELLRAIENNFKIGTLELNGDSFSIDVLRDYHRAINYIKKDIIKRNYI
ncbi:3-deoxy-manno-octulosonate cytidylyltransferase [Candidatus Pelagibacter sp.]|jgi:3-deoxy-manno-octulosonate cytidylyltransferase (CMP-KDO synthetase)|nr:3-deoxy-manno-octulosonate cytidylyltransferase [Candidatus Pelagibacter sp.]MDC1248461.1 3-deoxy-manno-octulosonate cytidylyltransferase [Pelagibacteraceae bacterium]